MQLIQRAALDEALWPAAVARVADAVGGATGLLFSPTTAPSDGGFWASCGIDPSHMGPYVEYYMERDLWRQYAGTRMDGDRAFIGDEIVSTSEMRNSEIYNDFFRPMNIGRMVWAPALPSTSDIVPGGLHLSIYRPLADESFAKRDEELLHRLLPHLRTALATRHALKRNADQLALARGALTVIDTGVMVIACDARILFLNEVADRILRRNDPLSRDQDRFSACRHHDAVRLRKFIASIFSTDIQRRPPPDALNFSRGDAAEPLVVRGQQLPDDAAAFQGIPKPAAVIFLRDTQAGIDKALNWFTGRYALTEAEAWLAGGLAAGRSLQEIAVSRRVGRETVRTHLKSIFSKTGCRRQAEVVSLILSAVAP